MSITKKYAETHPLTWWFQHRDQIIWMEDYINKNGYLALKKVLKDMSSTDVVNVVTKSGLKGRGGAGFLTGIKWGLMLNVLSSEERYLLCNADEMEPGTFKDRVLMEQVPHQLIEGMIIAAFAVQATCGYIFLRGEYIEAERVLKRAILEAYNYQYLGQNIMHSNFSFNLYVHTGAGRYICGEETALINSLEGRRANPRFKPPFPATVGLWGKPTCVNNVETLSNIPSIMLNGVDWYHGLSNSKDSGTKMMGFSGMVNNPGVWELPFGISARELLEKYAGGMKDGCILKAWLPGGASTGFLTVDHLDISMDFFNVSSIGSRFGTGVAMVVDNTINIVSLVRNIEEFFSRESCGLCTPCRDGLPWVVKILDDILSKCGRKTDITLLEELCGYLSPGNTFCAHAPGAVMPLKSAMQYFRSEFEDGVS
ncbi:MAG: NADH-quinone oxidoreductase subunit NuoF [Buchnera aphidicola (Eriosoma harunire)]